MCPSMARNFLPCFGTSSCRLARIRFVHCRVYSVYVYMYVYQGQPLPHQQLIDAVDSSCCSLTSQDTASLVSSHSNIALNELLLSSIINYHILTSYYSYYSFIRSLLYLCEIVYIQCSSTVKRTRLLSTHRS